MYLIAILIGLVAIYLVFSELDNKFSSTQNCDFVLPIDKLYKQIHNKIIIKANDGDYYQFSNLHLPSDNSYVSIESLLVSPKGVFIFNTINLSNLVIKDDFGYLKITSSGEKERLHISDNLPSTFKYAILDRFPCIRHLPIHYYNVFINDLEINTLKATNAIHIDDISNIVSKHAIILDKIDTKEIIGSIGFANMNSQIHKTNILKKA